LTNGAGSRRERRNPDNGAEQYQPTVLVVEDDEDSRFAMARVLVQEEYLVLTAATAHDALGIMRTHYSAIDVVVLDVHLPDASGINLLRPLHEQYPGTRVVVCTGAATPEEAAELLRLGAHRYLRKPVSPDELLATVEASLP
jgi:DNA-binding NtrC family response regulator